MDEDVAGFLRIDLPVVHAPFGHEFEPEDRDALVGHNPPTVLVPAGIAVGSLEQVRSELFDPVRLDRRERARVLLRRPHDFASHHPLRPVLEEHAARKDVVAIAAAARVVAQLAIMLHLGRDDAQQPREQRAMQPLGLGGLLVGPQVQLRRHLGKLRVQILPLAQPHERNKPLLAPPPQLAPR